MSLYALKLACALCFLLFLQVPGNSGGYCNSEVYYIIKHQESGLVLEVNENAKSGAVLNYTNYSPQLWRFEDGSRPGSFYVVNKETGTVLDVDNGRIVVKEKSGSLSQRWFIHEDGVFVNSHDGKVLDVLKDHNVPGDPLRVIDSNGTGAQKFLVQKSELNFTIIEHVYKFFGFKM